MPRRGFQPDAGFIAKALFFKEGGARRCYFGLRHWRKTRATGVFEI